MTRRLFAVLRQQPIALLALFVALGGTSFAAVSAKGSDSNVIIGCVGDRSGQLRVVDSAVRCGSRETAISFDREGDQGKTGARGKAGDDGSNGRAGAVGKDGVNGAGGPAGHDGATGTAGHDGAAGPDGATGAAGIDGEDGDTGPRGLPGADASDTPSELLTALMTVDGTGSGLDADTVDGLQAGALLTSSVFNSLFGNGSQTAVNNSEGADCLLTSIVLTAATYPLPGTVFANGQILSQQQNAALFSLLGNRFGGTAPTTFALPDLRKQAPAGTNYAICIEGIYPPH